MDKEVDLRVKQELEKKRHEIEQEIRQKLLEEERAKIRAELEMEKRIENMMQEQQKFKIEKERERREQEELQRKQAMTQQVEDDFYDLVAKLEQQFVDVRARGLNNVLDMIFASSTFKTIQVYSATLTSMNFEQKQNLVVDLRQLLETIANAVQANTPAICAVPAPVQLPAMTYKAPTSSRNEQVGWVYIAVGCQKERLCITQVCLFFSHIRFFHVQILSPIYSKYNDSASFWHPTSLVFMFIFRFPISLIFISCFTR